MARTAVADALTTPGELEEPPPMISGIEPRYERDLRIWAAIVMWLGGASAIGVGATLPGSAGHIPELGALVFLCFTAVLFSFFVFRRVSDGTLYVLNNVFSTLGALTIWFACFWSGGASSGLAELYLFPVLYDAYFFRARDVVWHLVLNSALALSPLIYDASLRGTQFPARAAVLVSGFWAISWVVGYRKRRLLGAELDSRRRALSDPLTGVHNRRSFHERTQAEPPARGSAFVMLDVDNFKAVNSEYGHLGADELLRQVSLGLLAITDDRDCVARVGGDEFAILTSGRTESEIRALAGDCRRAVGTARARAGLEGSDLSGSVGYAIWPEGGETWDELMDAADSDMFKAKGDGRRQRAGLASVLAMPGRGSGGEIAPSHDRAIAGPGPTLVRKTAGAPEAGTREPAHGTVTTQARSKATAAALAWLGAAIVTLGVTLLPFADRSHVALLLALIAFAVAMAALMFTVAPVLGESAYVVSDALAIPVIALGVYATGGTTSPLLPLVFVVVAFAAYFSASGTMLRLAGAVVVCASPFIYSSGDASLEYTVRFVALVTTAGVLVGIILYNKRELGVAELTAHELASHDSLTGLPNRRAFNRQACGVLNDASTEAEPLVAIAMVDLDNFKQVNDRHGHGAGDAVLQAIAQALRSVTRPEDCVARIGGDEFALLARDADAAVTRALGERCVAAIEDAVAETGYGDCGVSATIGYALYPHHANTLDELLQAADSALMRAKANGKRRVDGAPARTGVAG